MECRQGEYPCWAGSQCSGEEIGDDDENSNDDNTGVLMQKMVGVVMVVRELGSKHKEELTAAAAERWPRTLFLVTISTGEVITTDICRYLGPDALTKPGSYKV